MKTAINNISDYDQQAIDFLESTNTSLEINYSHTDKYFSDDTEKRDIYRFTLINPKGSYSSLFGDSINNTEYNKWISGGKTCEYKQDWDFCKQNKIRVLPSGHVPKQGKRKAPSSYDILACMDSYVPDTFDEFCDEYGYNDLPLSDHDKIMRVFLNIREQVSSMHKLFTSEQLEQLSEIN